jgi:hypothetical protein
MDDEERAHRKYILDEMIRPLYNGKVVGGNVSADGFPLLKFEFRDDAAQTIRYRWVAVSMDDEMNDGGRLIFIDEGGAYERPR